MIQIYAGEAAASFLAKQFGKVLPQLSTVTHLSLVLKHNEELLSIFFLPTLRTGSHVLNSKTSSPQVTASYWFLLISYYPVSAVSPVLLFLGLSHLNFLSLCLSSLAFHVNISRKALVVIKVKWWSENKDDCSASSVLWRYTVAIWSICT